MLVATLPWQGFPSYNQFEQNIYNIPFIVYHEKHEIFNNTFSVRHPLFFTFENWEFLNEFLHWKMSKYFFLFRIVVVVVYRPEFSMSLWHKGAL